MSAVYQLPIVSPMVVFREEPDEWGVLFDPETNETFALDPTSVFIWKRLDGKHSKSDILTELNKACEGVPADASRHLDEFLEELTSKSLIGFEK